ncbi:MAG: sulfotransferase [Arenibacter sp.]
MSSYSKSEKILHKLYLSNYFLSKSSLELEEIIFGPKAKNNQIKEYVFITGLARSGTTALMNKIFGSNEYASLQYSNMPILLSPNLWNKKLNIAAHERAHKDGIIIDGNSPEEFDEYFWKAFMKDSYIKDGLLPHAVTEDILNKYLTYTSLICLSKQKQKYISKNNNNILRLSTLKKINNSKIFILFREPISHASSLMKLHRSFSDSQLDDPFVLDYFNYLGHHEFGLNHKPFLLTENFIKTRTQYTLEDINYWLILWINYYEYVLDNIDDSFMLISFENLVNEPDSVFKYVSKTLQIQPFPNSIKKHKPTIYKTVPCNLELHNRAKEVYNKLATLIKY